MFKKIDFKGLNYKDLERFDSHDLKRDNVHSFYQTFDFLELVQKWPEIIGPAFAKVTSPLKIKGDSLIIVTTHSSYSHNISYLSEELKQKIFVLFPALKPVIKKLNFQTQENFFQQKKAEEAKKPAIPKLHPQDPRYKVMKQEADRLFGDIEETELRELMMSIFMQSR